MHAFQELLVPEDFSEAKILLRQAGLDFPEGITFGLGAYEDGALMGTGFLAGSTVCGICVSPAGQGSGLAAAIVSRLVQHALQNGISRLFLFTKPTEASKFDDIGFHPLVATGSAVLLEWGRPNYETWTQHTKKTLGDAAPTCAATNARFPLGAIVMNANPFTLGHRHLALHALEQCERVAVFVVEEDASAFPFSVRYSLVREGLADQTRIVVLPGGPYMVSRASFPSYFTGKSEHAQVHAELDCSMFAERIAPDLGIAARFVGEEPYCAVTAAYNAIMRDILPAHGIECVEIPRLATEKAPISASSVRALLKERGVSLKDLASLVPASTASFLALPEAQTILEKLR